MTQTIPRQQTTVAEPAPTPEPAVTSYQKLAAEIGAAFNEIVARIPGYNDDLSNIPKRVRRPVTADFVGMSVAAVEAVSELQGVKQLDPANCRNTFQFSQAFQPLRDQFRGAERRLDLLMRVAEATAGRDALGIYSIAKRVAMNPNNTEIAVHVKNLKGELRRPRRTKVPAPAAPEGGATTKN